jgi:hypothetical protein
VSPGPSGPFSPLPFAPERPPWPSPARCWEPVGLGRAQPTRPTWPPTWPSGPSGQLLWVI